MTHENIDQSDLSCYYSTHDKITSDENGRVLKMELD